MSQGPADLDVSQSRVPRADATVGWTVLRFHDVEEDVSESPSELEAIGHFDAICVPQRRNRSRRELGDHVQIAVDERLDPGVGICEGLEDDLVHAGSAVVVGIVRFQPHELILGVFGQGERPGADHLVICESSGVVDGFPDVPGKDVHSRQAVFECRQRSLGGHGHSGRVGRLDGREWREIRRQEGEILRVAI